MLPNNERVEQPGFGRTVNISTGGILFEVDARLPVTGPIEVAIHWPHLLDGVVTLKLVMRGHIVRSDANAIAIKAEHHEFRTGRRALSESNLGPRGLAAGGTTREACLVMCPSRSAGRSS